MLSLIEDKKRHLELLSRINVMRKSKAFCDVTINVENKEFFAHKVMLASYSDYFLNKFTEDESCKRFTLDMNKDVFASLLEYFYTSSLVVHKDTVPQIFSAVRFLKVKRLVKICEQFLSNNLSLDNVMEIRQLITPAESEDLCIVTDNYIRKNIDNLIVKNRSGSLNMDIVVETFVKKESAEPLANLVVDWLEYATTDGNLKIWELMEENIVLCLTSSNSLVQFNEIQSNKNSTFMKDYLRGFINVQKQNIASRVKSRPRSKERILRQSQNNISTSKKSHQQSFEQIKKRETEEMIVSPNDDQKIQQRCSDLNSDINGNVCDQNQHPPPINGDSMDLGTTSGESSLGAAADEIFLIKNISGLESQNHTNDSDFGDDECFEEEYDSVSSSIKSKSSSTAGNESCVIAVTCEDTEAHDQSSGVQNIKFLAKVCGKMILVSLHIKSMLDIINQSMQESAGGVDLSLYQHQSFANAFSSSIHNNCPYQQQSEVSSSSVSASSSQLHIDTLYCDSGSDEHHLPPGGTGSIVVDNSEQDRVQIWHQFLLKKVSNQQISLDPIRKMSTPRCAAGTINYSADKLMVIGGFNRGECLNSIEVYFSHKNEWIQSEIPPMNRCRARLAALDAKPYDDASFPSTTLDRENSFICAIGGSDGYKELSSVERYDPETKSWIDIAELNQARSHHDGCVVQHYSSGYGKMIVCGGLCGSQALKCCEFYDFEKNSWYNMSPLSTGRSQAAIAAIDNQVYVVGGTDFFWSCTPSCEVMDIREGKWRALPDLSRCRRGAALIPYNGSLYLFGGSDGQMSLKSLEIFDVAANQWVASGQVMKQPRANVCGGRLVHNGIARLVAVGGFTGKHFLDTVEWTEFIRPSLACDCNDEWSMTIPDNWLSGDNFNSIIADECNYEHDTTITASDKQQQSQMVRMLMKQSEKSKCNLTN